MRKRILLALFIGFLIPIPQTIAPAWTAQVVDESGVPQPDVTVREVWRQYTFESEDHEQVLRTNAQGSVSFPRRRPWRPLAANVIGGILNLRYGVHASWGPQAYLIAWRDGQESFVDRCENCRMVLHSMK